MRQILRQPLKLSLYLSSFILLAAITYTVLSTWHKQDTRTPSGIVISKITWNPAAPLPGDPVTFYAEIKGQGRRAPHDATYRVRFAIDGVEYSVTDAVTLPFRSGTVYMQSSNSDLREDGKADWWMAVDGPHTITATLDRMGTGPNHTAYDTVYVGLLKAGKPDLVINDVTAAPATDGSGKTVLTATVRNVGNYATPLFPLQVVFRIGDAKIAETNDTAQPLKPGEAREFSAYTENNSVGTSGQFTVRAIVNENERLGDLSLFNNEITKTVNVAGQQQ